MKIQLLLYTLILLSWTPKLWAQERPKHQNPNPQVNKVLRESRIQTSSKKNYKVSYTPSPDPIPFNSHFRLKLLIQSPTNELISDAQIQVKADMPEHNHGMSVKPQIKALGKGLYEVRGLLFHMPGYWEITVTIQHQKHKEEAVFGLNLTMPKMPSHHQH